MLIIIPSTWTVVCDESSPRPSIRDCCTPEVPPTSGLRTLTPGTSRAYDHMLRPVGIASWVSRVMTSTRCTCCTSTTGVSPETVIVSSTEPTDITALIGSATSAPRMSWSRTSVPNPGRVKVTLYSPGRRSMML